MEERKIGEIFEFGGEWYQCVKSDGTCNGCVGKFQPYSFCNGFKECVGKIFKKLEKVGKTYEHYGKFYQCYKLPMETEIRLLPNNCYPIGKDNLVEIEIKQNKEDMEENKTNFVEAIDALCKRYNMSDGVRTDFISEVKEIIKDKEECNFKPFNLEAAKSGKPVCTRDGRKARIICFDLKNEEYPIVAAIWNDSSETILCYTINGEIIKGNYKSDKDLMMLPEKRKGWINIHQYDVYKTKEEAEAKVFDKANHLTTIEIEYWR